MEMFALIKDKKGTRTVKSSEVKEKADFIVKNRLNDFFDDLIQKNGENYKLTLRDANLFESKGGPFSWYIADKILRKNIIRKRDFELTRLLRSVFNEFNINASLIKTINSNYNLFSYFSSDENGNIVFDSSEVSNSFRYFFKESIGNEIFKELKRQLSVYEYNLEYSVLDFKNFILSSDDLIDINRKNFEYFLFELGEISDPKIPVSFRHKCYSCDNLSPLLCKKAEYYKERVDMYPFIKRGYQTFITTDYNDLNMVSFIVGECSDYVSCNDNSIDKEEFSYVKRRRR